jgi:transcriptional regulator with XRE-family HTH domain
MTQAELAGLAGLASSYVSMIERGRRTLTCRDHVNALAAALKVAPAEIAPGASRAVHRLRGQRGYLRGGGVAAPYGA